MSRASLLSKLIVCSLSLYFGLSANGQLVSDLLAGRFRAEGGIAAFYAGTEQTPSLVIRTDKIYTDYERKGFFRIGVLPVGVIAGVTFEVRRPESVTNTFAQMQKWLGPHAANRLELRQVKVVNLEGCTNRLESGRARIISNGRLEFFDGVRWYCGTNQVVAPHATLHISGKQTGQLVMGTTPPLTNNLFSRVECSETLTKADPK